ncbi:hypothetical protein R3P38DRAFT_3193386 [Favolaschia claudopus]|uniref:Uncharacterized protein n=1 Tax=Favolaschia claudopus TaxID=2862362 RepID=A0AAW0BHZ5_9AGAR
MKLPALKAGPTGLTEHDVDNYPKGHAIGTPHSFSWPQRGCLTPAAAAAAATKESFNKSFLQKPSRSPPDYMLVKRLAAPILHDHCVVRPLRRSFYLKPISTTRVLIRHHRFDGPSYLGCDHAASRKPIRATRYPNVEVLSRTGGRSGVDGAPSSKDPQ